MISGKFTLDEEEWENVSNEAKDLVRKLLEYNPDKRISAAAALQHPWIVNVAPTNTVSKTVAKKTLDNLKNFRAR